MARFWARVPDAHVVLGAMALDAVFGDPANRWHPVRWFGLAVSKLERVAYRDSTAGGAAFMGLALGPVLVAPTLMAPGGRLLEAVVLWLTLGGRTLCDEAEAVATLLEAGDLAGARRRVRSLVGRDTDELDEAEVARAVIESVAENTTDAVVGPLVWYAIGGLEAAIAFRAINTLDAMVGHKNDRYRNFGLFAAKGDDLAVTPAALVGLALTWGMASADGRRRIASCLRVVAGHPSLNAGLIEAGFAGALGVQLGGDNRYQGRWVVTPLLAGGEIPSVSAIRRACQLSRRLAWLTGLIMVAGMCMGD
jgi:adenosylcobinamide-phosphate synthase